MISVVHKKVIMINEHIPKCQAKSDNQTERMCQLKKGKLTKIIGSKHARFNERQEETNSIWQKVVQLILKRALIS